jgi:hypothetical protein
MAKRFYEEGATLKRKAGWARWTKAETGSLKK